MARHTAGSAMAQLGSASQGRRWASISGTSLRAEEVIMAHSCAVTSGRRPVVSASSRPTIQT